MATVLNTLLGKPELLAKDVRQDAFLYLVQGRDYRITVGVLLSLIDRALLGIDQIDNTSDANKPVSEAQATAIGLKADRQHRHAVSEIEGLAEALNALATQEMLQEAISALSNAMNGKATKTELAALADAISEQLILIQGRYDTLANRVTAIENATNSVVSHEELNQAVTALQLEVAESLREISSQFTLALNSKLDKSGSLPVGQVEGFEEAVKAIVEDMELRHPMEVGPHDW